MPRITRTFARALLSQIHPRMLLLTVAPFTLSLLIWGLALWLGLQPAIDWLQVWLAGHQWFQSTSEALGGLGRSTVRAVLVPLIAMWLLLPLMIITALIFVAALAMPVVARHVGQRRYPALVKQGQGSFVGSIWTSLSSLAIFILLWIVTLPLALIPLLTFVIQPLLWGWLTSRVMAYDALADHATEAERLAILRQHRWPLLGIGIVTGALGAAPTLLWLGGVLSIVLLPVLAAGAIWLYVVIFTLTGLWFTHYCLDALEDLRGTDLPEARSSPAKALTAADQPAKP